MLGNALRAGLGVEEFWSLTPRETALWMEARLWRAEQEHRQAVQMAWLTAALQRAKRLPRLQSLLGAEKPKALTGSELEQRKAEHEALIARMGVTRRGAKRD